MKLPTLAILIVLSGAVAATAAPVVKPAAAKAAVKPGAAPAEARLDLAPWLAERSSALAIKKRTYDPFGRRKDGARPPQVVDPSGTHVANPDVDAPPVDMKAVFSQAVSELAGKVMMVGSRQLTLQGGTTLREGQVFSLNAQNQKLKVRVVSVGPKGILMENQENQHRVLIPSPGGLPSGMSQGGGPGPLLAP